MTKIDWLTVRNWIFQRLTWILIILSLIAFLLSASTLFIDKVNDLLEKAGLTMLSSGIFTAILKSLQFTGIFKEEITKVMIGTDFIKNRNDLPILWKEISKTIYNRKFPKISEDLENRILQTYFPTNENFYYEDYNVSINISEINDDFEIFYEQVCEYKVVLDSNSSIALLQIESEISDDDDDNSKIINELVYFLKDGINLELKEDPSTIENPKKTLYKIELTNKKEFLIKSKYRRKYPLKNENYKLFRMKHFTKGMSVFVNFPTNVRVSFFNIGLISGFVNLNEDFPNHICRIHKNDIILPQQGFGMSFEKI